MNVKKFVSAYNRSDYEGRATALHVRAVLADQGWNPDMFGDHEADFEEVAALYQSRKDFIEVPRNTIEKQASKETLREKPSPFVSSWYRCEKCEMRQHDPGSVVKASDKSPYWIFLYSGKVEEYKPDAATLEDALNIRTPENPFDKPDESARSFFERWGPLGIHHILCPPYFVTPAGGGPSFARLDIPYNTVQNAVLLNIPKGIHATEFWRLFHLTEIEEDDVWRLNVPHQLFFDGYFEYGFMALRELQILRLAWDLKEQGAFHLLNAYLEQGTRNTVEVEAAGPRRRMKFKSLRDALYGQIALEIGRPWLECKNDECQRTFLRTKDPRQEHCCDRCRLRYADNERRKREKKQRRRSKK